MGQICVRYATTLFVVYLKKRGTTYQDKCAI